MRLHCYSFVFALDLHASIACDLDRNARASSDYSESKFLALSRKTTRYMIATPELLDDA